MNNYSEVFRYFQNNVTTLKDEFGLKSYSYNPCSFRKKEDLRSFVKRLASTVFEVDDLEFSQDIDSQNELIFKFCGQELSLSIDEKFGHIELDFYKTVEFMAQLSQVMIASINPTGVCIGGDYEDMIEAWSKGLPIHIPAVKSIFYKHMNGKLYRKEEIQSELIVSTLISLEDYEVSIIRYLNKFLDDIELGIQYNSNQVKCYSDDCVHCCVSISGDYAGRFKIDKENHVTTFSNSLIHQIFLLNYLSIRNVPVYYKEKSKEKILINDSFDLFLDHLGK
jgi:hypothetical protein